MKVTRAALPGVLLIEPKVFGDARGFFKETWHRDRYGEAGIPAEFPQDNASLSARGVLRGLHLQHPQGQGKLVQVLIGEVFDVAVDVRRGSPDFGKWIGVNLSADNHRQLYIPPGFAHGFCVTSESALFHYKCTRLYAPDKEITIAWDDPDIGIDWPAGEWEVSAKDQAGKPLSALGEQLPAFGG